MGEILLYRYLSVCLHKLNVKLNISLLLLNQFSYKGHEGMKEHLILTHLLLPSSRLFAKFKVKH